MTRSFLHYLTHKEAHELSLSSFEVIGLLWISIDDPLNEWLQRACIGDLLEALSGNICLDGYV